MTLRELARSWKRLKASEIISLAPHPTAALSLEITEGVVVVVVVVVAVVLDESEEEAEVKLLLLLSDEVVEELRLEAGIIVDFTGVFLPEFATGVVNPEATIGVATPEVTPEGTLVLAPPPCREEAIDLSSSEAEAAARKSRICLSSRFKSSESSFNETY